MALSTSHHGRMSHTPLAEFFPHSLCRQ